MSTPINGSNSYVNAADQWTAESGDVRRDYDYPISMEEATANSRAAGNAAVTTAYDPDGLGGDGYGAELTQAAQNVDPTQTVQYQIDTALAPLASELDTLTGDQQLTDRILMTFQRDAVSAYGDEQGLEYLASLGSNTANLPQLAAQLYESYGTETTPITNAEVRSTYGTTATPVASNSDATLTADQQTAIDNLDVNGKLLVVRVAQLTGNANVSSSIIQSVNDAISSATTIQDVANVATQLQDPNSREAIAQQLATQLAQSTDSQTPVDTSDATLTADQQTAIDNLDVNGKLLVDRVAELTGDSSTSDGVIQTINAAIQGATTIQDVASIATKLQDPESREAIAQQLATELAQAQVESASDSSSASTSSGSVNPLLAVGGTAFAGGIAANAIAKRAQRRVLNSSSFAESLASVREAATAEQRVPQFNANLRSQVVKLVKAGKRDEASALLKQAQAARTTRVDAIGALHESTESLATRAAARSAASQAPAEGRRFINGSADTAPTVDASQPRTAGKRFVNGSAWRARIANKAIKVPNVKASLGELNSAKLAITDAKELLGSKSVFGMTARSATSELSHALTLGKVARGGAIAAVVGGTLLATPMIANAVLGTATNAEQ